MFWDWTFYRTCCILLDPQVGPTPIVSVKDGRTEFIVLIRIIIVRDLRKNEYWRLYHDGIGLVSYRLSAGLWRWQQLSQGRFEYLCCVFVYLNLCIWIFVFEFVYLNFRTYLNFGICSCVKLYLCFHSSVFVRWSMTVAATEPRSLRVFVYLNFRICSCAIAFMYS